MKHSKFKTAGLIILGIVIIVAAAAAIVWGGEISSVLSVKQVEGNRYLYTMEYNAPYDLDELIAADIDSNAGLLEYVVAKVGKGIPISISSSQTEPMTAGEAQGFSCTSFQVVNAAGGYLYGRNYDFFKNPVLVTRSHPAGGYASIAVSDMSHFGYSLEKLPESLGSKVLCLASVYAPVDGINEKGLCTSIMALPKQAAHQDSGRHKVGTSILMRLFLDRCSTVGEALDLLSTVDVCHDAVVGSGYHYMVADAAGDCAVIEFDPEDGWKTMVVRKPADGQAMLVTNHLLSPKYYSPVPDQKVGNVHSRSWWRYETAAGYIAGKHGVLTEEEAQECLSAVHWADFVWDDGVTVEDTQYSCVYDQSSPALLIRTWNDWETSYRFAL